MSEKSLRVSLGSTARKALILGLVAIMIPGTLIWVNLAFGSVRIFEDGFENGLTPWSGQSVSPGNTLSVVSDQYHHGSYSLKSVIQDNTYAYAYYVFSGRVDVYLRVWFRASVRLPLYGAEILKVATGNWGTSGHYVSVGYQSGSKGFSFTTHSASGWSTDYVNQPVQLDRWYAIEVYAAKGSSVSQRFWLDGVLAFTRNVNTASKTDIDRFRVGLQSSSWNGQITAHYDCVVLDDDTQIGTSCGESPPPEPSPPLWSDLGHNATDVDSPVKFSAKWTDPNGLSGYVFGWNGTGTWTNSTWVPLSGTTAWSNVTRTLPSIKATVVGYRFYANETNRGWNATDIGTLVTTKPPTWEPTVLTVNFDPAPSPQLPPFRYRVYGSLTIQSNGTGVTGAPIDFYLGFSPDYSYLTTVITNSTGFYEFYFSTVASGEYALRGIYLGDREWIIGSFAELNAIW